MKLLSIRLHPFGGTTDRTITLHDGLNVLQGANEYGKTTLVHALWHALNTSTDLVPSALEKNMRRWFPLPTGDHVRVTLCFDAEGSTWTLEKTWGAGRSARLQAGNGAPMADPSGVQQRLRTLLRLNEATWKRVLFTGQAQLSRTLEHLAKEGTTLDDVHGLLQGAAAIPGDIPAARLRSVLDDRIDAHYSNWDRTTNAPRGGRGIGNPWKNKVGPVLAAYYTKESLRAELEMVVAHERAVDAVNERSARLTATFQKAEPFITEGRTLRNGLSSRIGLEEKVQRLTNTVQQLMAIVNAWPGATQVITAKAEELERSATELEKVQAELDSARKHAQAQHLRDVHRRITEARAAWQEACSKLAALPAVDPQALQQLRTLEQDINELQIQVEAQKLVARLESTGARSVTVQSGTEAPASIALAPGQPWQADAAGRFSATVDDLHITVQSGLEDVDALFGKLENARLHRAELLTALGQPSLADAVAAATAHVDLYKAALQDRAEEEWEAAVKELTALPATRDGAVLEEERTRLFKQQAWIRAEIDTKRTQVEGWTQEHESVDALMEKVIVHRAELSGAQQELAVLPALPHGFASVKDYLEALDAREREQEGVKEQLDTARREHARLEGLTPARTAEELREELDLKEREFQRRMAEGQALLRIQQRLAAVAAAREAGDPLQGLADAVARYFGALTADRYTRVELEGTTPGHVHGPVRLPATQLSQGALGSLALATRLALAELYLRNDNGFLLLDDPFTDLDPQRRSRAIHALMQFAAQRQVVLFTCHPEHADALVEAGATGVGEP
jgi:exonuclease SbcC